MLQLPPSEQNAASQRSSATSRPDSVLIACAVVVLRFDRNCYNESTISRVLTAEPFSAATYSFFSVGLSSNPLAP